MKTKLKIFVALFVVVAAVALRLTLTSASGSSGVVLTFVRFEITNGQRQALIQVKNLGPRPISFKSAGLDTTEYSLETQTPFGNFWAGGLNITHIGETTLAPSQTAAFRVRNVPAKSWRVGIDATDIRFRDRLPYWIRRRFPLSIRYPKSYKVWSPYITNYNEGQDA